MLIEEIEWDDGNLEHATGHGVSVAEITQAIENVTVVRKNRKGGSGTHLIEGATAGGRRVEVVVLYRPDSHVVRPITAWEVVR